VKGQIVNAVEKISAPLHPRRRPIPLRSAKDARRFLGRLANKVYCDQLDAVKAGRIAFILSVYLRSIEVDVLEAKLAELEKRINGGSTIEYFKAD